MRHMLIAFDLDGTLMDSMGSTLVLLGEAIEHVTGQKLLHEQISSHFGYPEEVIVARAVSPDAAIVKAIMDRYVENLDTHGGEINLFRDVAVGLTQLKKVAAGAPLAVSLALYTARGRRATEVLFRVHGLGQWFDNWITGSDIQQGKPHPEGLLQVLKIASRGRSLPEDDVIYVGDSPKDIRMVHAIGGMGLGVRWCEHADPAALALAKPDAMFDEPRELFRFLLDQIAQRPRPS